MSYLATFSNIIHCGASHNAKFIEQAGKATSDTLVCFGYRSKEQCIELIPKLISVRICVLCCSERSTRFNDYMEFTTHYYFTITVIAGFNIHHAYLKVSLTTAIKPSFNSMFD
ncbi:hypothetical protein DOD04_00500 [Klebsiella michiganensis]|nr:hypothetical protein DOD04_00500 [Klebsiella michiganensis]